MEGGGRHQRRRAVCRGEWFAVRVKEGAPELRAGCVYHTADDLSLYYPDNQLGAGVFSLKDVREEKVEGLGPHRNKPPSAWFRLCIP